MSTKQNITLSLNKDVLKKAKSLAAEQGSSMSQMLAQFINAMVQKQEAYEIAKRRAFQLMDHGFKLGGKLLASRDELHER